MREERDGRGMREERDEGGEGWERERKGEWGGKGGLSGTCNEQQVPSSTHSLYCKQPM